MAQPRTTHQALFDHIEGADTGVLRRVLEHAMQRLIDAEAAAHIGAGAHERASTRTTYRNWHHERVLGTGSGRLELQSGSFFSSLLEPRRRIDRALLAVVQEAYVRGISTRKVDGLMPPWVAAASDAAGEPDLRTARRGARRVPRATPRRAVHVRVVRRHLREGP